GDGFASRNARASRRRSSCSGLNEKSITCSAFSSTTWKPEHALADDVAQDLARPRLDRVAARAELLVLPVPVRIAAAVRQLRMRTEDLERELGQALVVLRPDELRRR